jgi:hypothetical protein
MDVGAPATSDGSVDFPLLNGLLKRFQVCAISGDSGRGNDYPVNAMGVDCLEVSNWQDTALVIQTILV